MGGTQSRDGKGGSGPRVGLAEQTKCGAPIACKVHLFLQSEELGSPGASSLGTWRRDQGPPRPARGPSKGGKKETCSPNGPLAWPRLAALRTSVTAEFGLASR